MYIIVTKDLPQPDTIYVDKKVIREIEVIQTEIVYVDKQIIVPTGWSPERVNALIDEMLELAVLNAKEDYSRRDLQGDWFLDVQMTYDQVIEWIEQYED